MTATRLLIPKFEPEVIAAKKRNWGLDPDDKVPTTSLRELVVHGVVLTSRWDEAHEYEVMAAAVEALPFGSRSQIKSGFLRQQGSLLPGRFVPSGCGVGEGDRARPRSIVLRAWRRPQRHRPVRARTRNRASLASSMSTRTSGGATRATRDSSV